MAAILMRTDPFRELDRLTQQMLGGAGTRARPSVMPMDAWRAGDTFQVEFDLPGVSPDMIELDVERNVVTVKAERAALDGAQARTVRSTASSSVSSRSAWLFAKTSGGRIFSVLAW